VVYRLLKKLKRKKATKDDEKYGKKFGMNYYAKYK